MTGQPQRRGRVIAAHEPQYPDPIRVQAGEPLEVSERADHWQDRPEWVWRWCTDRRGKSGWVPETYIEQSGDTARARQDYAATELTAAVGELVSIQGQESGWLWCVTADGRNGWLPITSVAAEGNG